MTTEWQSVDTMPDSDALILFAGPNGRVEVHRANQIRKLFQRTEAPLTLPGFFWAPVDPPPKDAATK